MNIEFIKDLFLYSTLPGAAGAFCWFLCGIKNNWIKNNKFKRKVLVEVLGGMIVATFLGIPFSELFAKNMPTIFVCFAIGVSWSKIIQSIRCSITKHIEKFLD